ncbi:YdaU family protein [Rhizobium tubonense]|uniref:DUF1376 domain-containing protein n=1 Tax=Rhizobium tubonense TaxID=484088 RepID=A0A2W4C116_9HYPH|nr:DUF1376 domain-containing protein [Rhizobium tubonense]PZM07599.1 hypothetical protein CPY51_31210 [Rhizobium tubonense]
MAEHPTMPLHTDSYLADTTHLNAQEHGAYLLLLMVAWRSAGLHLPDDDKLLARYAKVDPRTWAHLKAVIMSFWELSDGFWTQKKQQKVWDDVSKRVNANRANGPLGGRPKSLKTHKTGKPIGSENETQKNPTKTKAKSIEPNGPIEEISIDISLREFEEFWSIYPKKVDRKKSLKAFVAARKRAPVPNIMTGAQTYAGERAGKEIQFTKNAATWLNNDCWSEPPPASTAGTWRDDPIYAGVD